jgi:hypothetical protein
MIELNFLENKKGNKLPMPFTRLPGKYGSNLNMCHVLMLTKKIERKEITLII